MKPAYEIITKDLATVRSAPGERIVDAGRLITSVCVLGFPAGSGPSIAFGDSGAPIPLLTQGQTFYEEGCVICDEGLFLINPAAAGTLLLYVAYGSGPTVTS